MIHFAWLLIYGPVVLGGFIAVVADCLEKEEERGD